VTLDVMGSTHTSKTFSGNMSATLEGTQRADLLQSYAFQQK
jgi:hypothetical protein